MLKPDSEQGAPAIRSECTEFTPTLRSSVGIAAVLGYIDAAAQGHDRHGSTRAAPVAQGEASIATRNRDVLPALAAACFAVCAATAAGQPVLAPHETEVVAGDWVHAWVEGHVDSAAPRATAVVVYDSITGCAEFTRFTAAPAAIFDDGSFTPGPAALLGATVSGLDLMIRPFVAIPVIRIRVAFYNTVTISGVGVPPIVQSEPLGSLTLVLQGTQANTTPGVHAVTAEIPPISIPSNTFGVELAFVDGTGAILPNGQITAMFPSSACALLQPVVGSSQALFWIDNDFGNLTGDGIRYEPPNPAFPGIDQGDQLFWNPGGADNNLAIRLRGMPVLVSIGACCQTVPPYACTVVAESLCGGANQLFIGPGSVCDTAHCLPPPPNDQCVNAVSISGFGDFAYDNLGATTNGPADCPDGVSAAITRDVWFRWTAPCDGQMELETCRATVTDDKLAVYSTSACAALAGAQLACDDNGCGGGTFQSRLSFPAIAGEVYLLRLGTHEDMPGASGNFFRINRLDGPCPIACPTDWDGNGQVEVTDIFTFLTAWFAGDPNALFYGGDLGVPAIFAFLSDWFAHGVGPC